jgi:very-short-patch-repair endonuclease
VDLAYPLLRIAIEFEGDQHRTDPRQWQRDIEKHERLADLGWRVIRVSREHVFADPESIVRRVRGAIAARR